MRSNQPPFEQLRPLLGSRIDALEAAWVTAGADERAEIEITLELMRRQAATRHSTLLEPPRGAEADGPVRVGRIVHGRHELGWLGLEKRELTQHLGVFGRSGSGKSVLCLGLLVQLLRQQTPWLIFDYKRSARALRAMELSSEVHVVTLGRHIDAAFSFNILAPPPGVPLDTHQRQLCELIAESWYAGDGVISVLERAMTECYQAFAPDLPTIADVRAHVENSATKGREAMWRQSALRILTQMTTGQLGRIFGRRRDTAALDALLREHTVIELDGLAVNDATFLTQHLMRYLTQSLLMRRQREELQFVCLVEEAHHLLAKKQGGSESILETCLREGREIGLGIILVDQTPSSISPVALANCYGVVVLNCRQRGDIQAAAGTLLLTEEQRGMLSTLPVGEAVARLSDRWPRPVHVRIPPLDLPKGQVSDDDVRLAYLAGPFAASSFDADSSESAHSNSNMGRADEREELSPVPPPDERTRATYSAHHTTTSTHPPTRHNTAQTQPNHPNGAGTDPLDEDPELRLLLEHVAGHPLMGVAARFDALGLSRRKGNAIKNLLVEEGLLEQVYVSTRTGRTVLLALTGEARDWLRRRRVAITGVNGSLPHAWWQKQAADLLEQAGWQVRTEHREGDHTFDVVGERGDSRLFLEVETGHSDWLRNFTHLERAEADHKLVVWLDDGSLLRARSSAPTGTEVLRPQEVERWIRSH